MLANRYLIEERPLIILPTLVGALGFAGASIVQQIYWLCGQPNSGRVLEDGEKWVWGTAEEWCDDYFPFWSSDTLRKHLKALENGGLLLSCQPKVKDWDRTKHYRVNLEMVNQYVEKYVREKEEERAKKGSKALPERTGTNMPHRTGMNMPHRTGMNMPVHIKEQKLPTETSTETSAAAAENWADPEAHRLLRLKFNRRNGAAAAEGKLEECMLEKPLRAKWRELTLEQVQTAIDQADVVYKAGSKTFTKALIDKLDDLVKPKTPPPPDEEESEKPKTPEERAKASAEAQKRFEESRRAAREAQRGT